MLSAFLIALKFTIIVAIVVVATVVLGRDMGDRP